MRAFTRDHEPPSAPSSAAVRSNVRARLSASRERARRALHHNVGESTTEETMQINVAVWHNDLRDVYNAAKTGAGAVAVLEVINLQLAQAAGWVADVTDDVFIEKSLANWREDYAAAQARLGVLVTELRRIIDSADTLSNKALAIHNFIARPVLDGIYPKDLVAKFPTLGKRGLTLQPGGTWKGQGDAYWSATLWNQAVIAGDINRKLGSDWATNAIRGTLTKVAEQLATSAPGEDPTAADAVIKALQKVADAPGDIFRAVTGLSPIVVAGAAAVVLVLAVILTR